jgi:mono/diheme cytochrome c family protein
MKAYQLPLVALVTLAGSLGIIAAAPGAGTEQAQTNKTVFEGVQVAQEAEPPQATLMTEGTALYKTNCAPCHGGNGQGGDGPKLAGNDFVKNQGGVITQILNGYEEHGMPPFRDVLKDREIAAIVNFVRNSFGNTGGPTTVETVRRTR